MANNTDIENQSFLDCDEETAHFYGTLDIETLGGAGFASQRTTGDDRKWDLSKYAGIQLDLAKGDSMFLITKTFPCSICAPSVPESEI